MHTTKLLTTKEIARKYGISHRTLESWRLNGKGPRFLRIGDSIRYDVDEFDQWTRRHDEAVH